MIPKRRLINDLRFFVLAWWPIGPWRRFAWDFWQTDMGWFEGRDLSTERSHLFRLMASNRGYTGR